jgi:hypothetical protein
VCILVKRLWHNFVNSLVTTEVCTLEVLLYHFFLWSIGSSKGRRDPWSYRGCVGRRDRRLEDGGEVHGDACNRTDQIIRAQVQKQAPKRSNFRTWAHIIPVVNRNHEGFQTNSLTTRIASFNIQHHTLHFTSSSEISLHTRSRIYYKPSL